MVLDNARSAEQVRPLLPGSPGCLAVVTSRNQLAGLVATEGACPLALDLLTAADARSLLIRRMGAGRVSAEPEAVECIIAACARLPLALDAARRAGDMTGEAHSLERLAAGYAKSGRIVQCQPHREVAAQGSRAPTPAGRRPGGLTSALAGLETRLEPV